MYTKLSYNSDELQRGIFTFLYPAVTPSPTRVSIHYTVRGSLNQ